MEVKGMKIAGCVGNGGDRYEEHSHVLCRRVNSMKLRDAPTSHHLSSTITHPLFHQFPSMSWSDSEPDEWNTPAITRNGFSFQDDKFYVAIGYHTHTRKDATELYALLTYTPPPPALTKAGKVAKRQPKDTHKDEEAHFYAAQLVHYGLKPLKTREPAKKRLLAAFGGAEGKTLEVPKAVLELEVALRKEWKELDAKMEERRELIRAEEKERMARYREAAEKEEAARQQAQKENPKKAEVAPQANEPVAKPTGGEVKKAPGPGVKKAVTQKASAMPITLDDSDDEPKIVAVNKNSKMTRAQMLQKITTLSESQAHGLLKKIFENVPATEKLFQAEFTITAKGKGSGTKSNTNGKKHEVSFIEKNIIIRALITKTHNREP